jgi:hypothetical protein
MPTSRAADVQKQKNRTAWFAALAKSPRGKPNERLAARFESFADTIQTRLDTSNGVGPSLTGSLEAQVDRALSQVLRQAPANGTWSAGSQGGSYGSSAGAGQGGYYGSATAAGAGGTQLMAQALPAGMLNGGVGGPPAIAPRQAALLQEATLTKGDLLSALDALQPLSSFADPSDVAALTAVIRAEVSLLIEEFSRTTLRPRAQRVRVLLGGLLGWDPLIRKQQTPGDISNLITLLNLGGPLVPTLIVEQQLASQGVLTGDAHELLQQWLDFRSSEPPGTIARPWARNLKDRTLPAGGLADLGPQPGVGKAKALGPASAQAAFRVAVKKAGKASQAASYAERLIQADLLLPVVGQDASRVAGALDAIGLSQGEQETFFLKLQSFVDMDVLPKATQTPPPGQRARKSVVRVRTTVTDILDWTASMADAKALDLVRQAGQLGLNLIADQADELFWLVVALLDRTAQDQMVELVDAQVQTELLTLARDLNLLANLAV